MFEQKTIKVLVENPLKSIKAIIKKKFPQGINSVPNPEDLKKIFIYCLNNKNPGVTSFIMDHFDLDANMLLDNNNTCPLHCASACGNLDAIITLLKRGADRELKTTVGGVEASFMDILYAKGHLDIRSEVKRLIMNKEKEPEAIPLSSKSKGQLNSDAYIIHRRNKKAEEAVPLLPGNTSRIIFGKKL